MAEWVAAVATFLAVLVALGLSRWDRIVAGHRAQLSDIDETRRVLYMALPSARSQQPITSYEVTATIANSLAHHSAATVLGPEATGEFVVRLTAGAATESEVVDVIAKLTTRYGEVEKAPPRWWRVFFP